MVNLEVEADETLALAPPIIAAHEETEPSPWSYEKAFKRNDGLISPAEQQMLQESRIAIAGMGGVGGVHLVTLARLGVGRFSIADPDVFDVSNFNRQYGATVSRLGRNKAEAMADAACEVNPSVSLRILSCAVDESNVDEFLAGASLVIDGLDFFAIEARRMLFREAAQRGLWTITAGPIGFSTAWVAFDPSGMSFDEYFDLNDSMSRVDQLIAFAVGLTPKATHLPYMDLSKASIKERTGPSSSLACQLASGVTAAAAIRILTKRNPPDAAPRYQQFDAYRNRFCHGKLWMGNRGPLQRLKRALLKRQFAGQL